MIRPPVVVSLNVGYPGGGESEVFEVPRDEWDTMTPAERTALCEQSADEFAADYIQSGWNIVDPDDYAATLEEGQ